MKFRKKPVVVEAFHYDGDLKDSKGHWYVPKWAVKAYENNVMFYGREPHFLYSPSELFIQTLEGTRHVSVGDYIIKDVNGELYPCKLDIFAKTYEPADGMKPIGEKYVWSCPNCNSYAIYGYEFDEKFKYCPKCGQKIDWSEAECK